MPSRKKAKGQARKKKAADTAASRWDIVPWRSRSGCRHCCPQPPPKHVSSQLLYISDKFIDAWKKSNSCAFNSLLDAYEQCPAALWEKEDRKMVIEFFVAQGAEYVLRHFQHDSQSEYNSYRKESAGGLALVVMLLERFDPTKDLSELFLRAFKLGKNNLKNQDTILGCRRSLTRFFHKRTSCSCLNEKYAAVKSQPKTGICVGCERRKDRRSLLYCTGCKAYQYCSRECQSNHWPRHKERCQDIAAKKGGVVKMPGLK